MNNKLRVILLLLSFLALFVINHDYVCGHLNENPFHSDKCPICKLFQSTELSPLLIVYKILFGILTVITYVCIIRTFSPLSIYLTTFSYRAPPLVK